MFTASYKNDLKRLRTCWRLTCSAFIVILAGVGTALAQPAVMEDEKENHAGSILELRDKQRALLLVYKSRVVDVSNGDQAIIDDVLKADPKPSGRYRWV